MKLIEETITSAMAETLTTRMRRVVALHCDPNGGSPYWIDRADLLGVVAERDIHTLDDLRCFGESDPAILRSRPLTDFIPRRLLADSHRLVIAQTGGTSGDGKWTAYRDDEFHEAFIEPFIAAAGPLGFPHHATWLFIGPSGPHIIGKAVRHLAAAFGSAEPFSVDFDPRWSRTLTKGSFAQQRYLGHVISQSLDILNTQSIEVLFTTPPVLRSLATKMTIRQREAIRAIHYGGLPVDPVELHRLQTETFPNAVHLSGYGNTLFGCLLELSLEPGRPLRYFPHGARLHFELVDDVGDLVSHGQQGRVRFSRFDETCLIVRMLERDVASAIALPANAPAGFLQPGLENPHTPTAILPDATSGLY